MKYLILILSLMMITPAMSADDLSANNEPEKKEVLIPEDTIRQLARDMAKLQFLMERFGAMVQEEYRKEQERWEREHPKHNDMHIKKGWEK